MASERTVAKQSSPDRKPPVSRPARPTPAATTKTAAQALQQRLGNQGTQALLARAASLNESAQKGTPAGMSFALQQASTAAPISASALSIPPTASMPHAAAPAQSFAFAPGQIPAGPKPGSMAAAGASGAMPSMEKPAAKPAAGLSEKSMAAPAGAKTAPAGVAAGKAASPEGAAGPSPLEAIAPAVSAVRQRAAGSRKHPPPAAPVASAQAAGINPKAEQTRTAAAQTVAHLDADAAKAENVKREQFKAKLKQAIEAATPQPTSEAEAEKVMKTGAADASKPLRGQLATERDAATGPLKSTAGTEVAAATQSAPPQADLQPEQVGAPPAPVSPAPVVPAALPKERLDYSSDRAPTDRAMAENNITRSQLEEGNDAAFGPALQARSTAEKHEATAEARYRQSEAKEQDHAQGAAQQALAQGLTGLHGARESRIGKVVGQQLGTKTKDAAERQRVTDKINSIKDKTRADVNAILDGMDTEAATIFEAGLKRAETAYEAAFEEAKGGIGTWLTTWGDSWKEHIKNSLAIAREKYFREVDKAIDEVADFVEGKLKAAKQRIADGRKEVDDYVKGLDDSLKQYGEEALQSVSADFDAMGADIDQRRDGLIDKLAQQYKASYERMSATEEKLREANQSLWQRAYAATVGAIQQIAAFKDMLLSVLAGAAAVVLDIIAHPIRFLGNLVSGIMQGLKNFLGKIGFYLQKGLMEWLFGALGSTGLQLPDKFDLQGIIGIVLQILGLTYANFRARAVVIVGEPVVAALEKAAEIFKIAVTEGVPGLWRFIKEQLADLKSMVLDAILDFVKERVIMAGITWIIGLLNPASAFFKACKAIYDIVVFFVNRASQIAALVSAITDSVGAIAKGALGATITAVEGALGRAVPVAIGFLASLLGLGDPAKPVRGFIEKARAPVNKAIDWVVNLAVKGVKAVGSFVKRLVGKTQGSGIKEDNKNEGTARKAAREAIISRIGAETTIEDAERIIRQIEVDLKPVGVKRISIGPEGKDEEQPILVEASPLTRVSALVSKKIMVAVSAKVTVSKGDVLEDIRRPPDKTWPFEESLNFMKSYSGEKQRAALGGTGRTSPLPSVSQPMRTPAKKGDQPGAGVIIEPTLGARELEILAWNTGVSIGRKDAEGEYETNVSHAEHQFVDWFLYRPKPWRDRVESIEVIVEATGAVEKICKKCAADFDKIRRLSPHIRLTTHFVKKGIADRKREKLKVKS